MALELALAARPAGIPSRAVMADNLCGRHLEIHAHVLSLRQLPSFSVGLLLTPLVSMCKHGARIQNALHCRHDVCDVCGGWYLYASDSVHQWRQLCYENIRPPQVLPQAHTRKKYQEAYADPGDITILSM